MQEEKPVKVVKNLVYAKMYRLQWENGDLSQDFYNITRANDILKNYAEYRRQMLEDRIPRRNIVTGKFI